MHWGSTVPHKKWGTLPKGLWATGSSIDVRRGDAEAVHDWLVGAFLAR